MTVTPAVKTRENRARRKATRRGLRLSKSPRRDPGALDYNLYALIDHTGKAVNAPLAGSFNHSWTLDQIKAHLNGKGRKSRP